NTRSKRDWSSDVCSSDLDRGGVDLGERGEVRDRAGGQRSVDLLLLGGVRHPLHLEVGAGVVHQRLVDRTVRVRGGGRVQHRHPGQRPGGAPAALSTLVATAAGGQCEGSSQHGSSAAGNPLPVSHATDPFSRCSSRGPADPGAEMSAGASLRSGLVQVVVVGWTGSAGAAASAASSSARWRNTGRTIRPTTATGRATPTSSSIGAAKRYISQ